MSQQNAEIIIHNSIRIILINPDNEILLMCANDPKTTTPDGTYNGRFWFTIGGEIEPNETDMQAAVRELHEETGLVHADVEFGPIVWFGSCDLVLSGTLKRLNQKFIVAHTNSRHISMDNFTESEKSVIERMEWFSLDKIKNHQDIIYPVGIDCYLPDILEGRYPVEPMNIDLDKKPESKDNQSD
tara:strand:+ start:81 stop:635 length:555 start_codon:yes stop_codon:yes gene_type:complete